jgi:undecaprenyl-diphosphatase
MVEILQAIILGIIEGITEFLPISSTGHLLVAEHVMGYKDTAEVFAVVIQMGAIAAVMWYYRNDLLNIVKGLFRRETSAKKFLVKWIIATLPAAIVGLLTRSTLDGLISVRLIGWTLIIGGVAIYIIEILHKQPHSTEKQPKLEKITYKQAFQIGLFQIFALVPGVSRSGATIMGGLLSGVSRVNATAFSFYLSIPIILIKEREAIPNVSGGGPALLIGTIVAFVSAYAAVKWLIKYVSTHDFKPFAYYRIILGILILLMVK